MENTRENWDRAAADYQNVFRLGLNDYNASLLHFWQSEGMLFPGAQVIDIGCGVGKYGTYLAELGYDVTLTDISGEMLRHAEANMARYKTPWAVYRCDFNEATGEEPVFAGGFDLAISTMSPAVHDTGTVRKLSCLTDAADADVEKLEKAVTALDALGDVTAEAQFVRDSLLPAMAAFTAALAEGAAKKMAVGSDMGCRYETKLVKKLSCLTDTADAAAEEVEKAVTALDALGDFTAESPFVRDEVLPKMAALRAVCDEAETVTAASYWPFPTYGDLLFGV